MQTEQLLERFLEETNYLEKDEILLIIAYGSRLTNSYTSSSDLDIFVVTEHNTFTAARLIDGYKIEIHGFQIDELKQDIMYVNTSRNSYLKSVLKTGKIIIDKINLYEQLCTLLDYQIKKSRNLNENYIEIVENYCTSFLLNEEKYKDVYYFLALEFLRKLYHAKENCSIIQSTKVYDLYNDEEKAKKYFLKLPKKEFIETYLQALKETNRNEQKKFIISFLKQFLDVKTKLSKSSNFLTTQEIKKKLITLNNQLIKCEEMLLKNHPYANCLYNLTVGSIITFAENIECDYEKLQELYEQAVNTTDTNERINYLEKLFCILDRNYRLDYDDYYLKIYR